MEPQDAPTTPKRSGDADRSHFDPDTFDSSPDSGPIWDDTYSPSLKNEHGGDHVSESSRGQSEPQTAEPWGQPEPPWELEPPTLPRDSTPTGASTGDAEKESAPRELPGAPGAPRELSPPVPASGEEEAWDERQGILPRSSASGCFRSGVSIPSPNAAESSTSGQDDEEEWHEPPTHPPGRGIWTWLFSRPTPRPASSPVPVIRFRSEPDLERESGYVTLAGSGPGTPPSRASGLRHHQHPAPPTPPPLQEAPALFSPICGCSRKPQPGQ